MVPILLQVVLPAVLGVLVLGFLVASKEYQVALVVVLVVVVDSDLRFLILRDPVAKADHLYVPILANVVHHNLPIGSSLAVPVLLPMAVAIPVP